LGGIREARAVRQALAVAAVSVSLLGWFLLDAIAQTAPKRKPRLPPNTKQIAQHIITMATTLSLVGHFLYYIVSQRDQIRPAIMTRNAQLNLRVRAALKAKLEKLAKEDRRTLSAYVEKLLDEHITEQARRAAKRV
jgi:hypothetical protein